MRSTVMTTFAAMALLTATSALCAPASSPGFDNADFELKTAQDLYDLCTAEEGKAAFRTARAFCYGYFTGAKHYHDAAAGAEVIEPLACPPASVSRAESVAVFVEFVRANPQKAGDQPIDVVFEAIAARWPCPAAK